MNAECSEFTSAFSIQHSELHVRGPVAADDGAFDGARQPVSIQSPASHSPSDAVAVRRARRLTGGERERRVFLADDRPADERRAARAGDGLGDLARGAATIRSSVRSSVPARRRRSRRATGARSRCRTPAACRRPTASIGPGSPTNGSSITRRSYQRFTVTIGFDAIALAVAPTSLTSAGGAAPAKSVRMPNHGTAAIDASGPGCARRARRRPSRACHPISDARERANAHFPAAALDEGARRLGVHLVQRPDRQRDRRGRRDPVRTSRRARGRTASRAPRLATG